jgi:adenylosuccinate synthase
VTHKIVVGLGFGDEGKGSTVDYLCSREDISAVIRYNGGPQCAHNVITPDGRHHTFAMFGSGSFHGVPTHLSQHVLVNPFNIMREWEALSKLVDVDLLDKMTIAEDALLVTPYHVLANRARESARGDARHGSTGQGIGETRAYQIHYGGDAPTMGDLWRPSVLLPKLTKLRARLELSTWGLTQEHEWADPGDLVTEYNEVLKAGLNIVANEYVDTLLDAGPCVFEGAQGVLLDEDFGFHPHTTWSHTNTQGAHDLLGRRAKKIIGVTRTYHTRHGAGPFPTEDYETTWAHLPEPHNNTHPWAGGWRVGALDLTLLRYAIQANGYIDELMVTHMDRLDQSIMATYGYERLDLDIPGTIDRLDLPSNRQEQERLTEFLSSPWLRPVQYNLLEDPSDVVEAIETATRYRPTYFSYGPTYEDKITVPSADLLATS